ncbi:MAG TPA: type I methionyl aminopeptidase, partial [Candidatus Moranbacteria bacterium]|nr:type I methionyl aminopeptidase [Candidatus Moranbacteria bacterium]
MQPQIKTTQEIELMRVGGKKLAEIMRELKKISRVGVSTAE